MKINILLISLVVFLSSCESSLNRFTKDTKGNATYSSTEVGAFADVLEGTILSIREVKISGSKGLGSGVGAALGGLGGAKHYDSESGKANAGAIGALVGAMVGKAIEESLTEDIGYEFLVRLSNGKVKSVVQIDKHNLRVGDEVFITYSGNSVRLARK